MINVISFMNSLKSRDNPPEFLRFANINIRANLMMPFFNHNKLFLNSSWLPRN